MKTLIRQGRVIEPATHFDQVTDLGIQDGKIAFIGEQPADFTPDEIVEAQNLVVCPGLIDTSVRLKEPSVESGASLKSELKAAAAGGITSLVVPPDTDPPLDEPGLVHTLRQTASRTNHIHVFPLGALTVKLKGEMLANMGELAEAGCAAFSQADNPVVNTEVLKRSMQYAATFNLPVWLRAKDPFLAQNGRAHEGEFSALRGIPAIPEEAELIALYTYIQLARATGAKLHVQQISSARSLDVIKQAKAEGLALTCDVAAHHVHLCDTDIGFFDTNCLVFPPLRSKKDRAALQVALTDGTIDAICSDHTPVEPDGKLRQFMDAEPGISGVETLLPLTLLWAEQSDIPLPIALEKITSAPARILGLKTGKLQTGSIADICIFDPNKTWIPSETTLKSFGKNTPFINKALKGKTLRTIIHGITVFKDE